MREMMIDATVFTVSALGVSTVGFIAGIFWNTYKTRDELTKDAKGIEERLGAKMFAESKKNDDALARIHARLDGMKDDQQRTIDGVRDTMSNQYVDNRYFAAVTEKIMNMLQNVEGKVDSLAKRFDDIIIHQKK